MKTTIKTKKLIEWLTPLGFVVRNNHIIPIYQNVKIDFFSDYVLFTGENMETRVTVRGDIKSNEDVSVCVNYSMLLNALKTLKNETIELSFLKNTIQIKHSKGLFKLPLIPSEEFITPDLKGLDKKVTVDAQKLKESLKLASKFVYSEEMDAFSNICVDIDKKISVYGTDRNRMFKSKLKGSGDKGTLLFSRIGGNSLCNLINFKGELNIHFNNEKIFFSHGNIEVSSVMQQGNYSIAKFNKILAAIEESDELIIDTEELIKAINRVSVFINKSNTYSVKFNIKQTNLTLECLDIEYSNEAKETLSCKFNRECIVGFNYKYITEIISVFEDAKLYIHPKHNFLFIKDKKNVGALAPLMIS